MAVCHKSEEILHFNSLKLLPVRHIFLARFFTWPKQKDRNSCRHNEGNDWWEDWLYAYMKESLMSFWVRFLNPAKCIWYVYGHVPSRFSRVRNHFWCPFNVVLDNERPFFPSWRHQDRRGVQPGWRLCAVHQWGKTVPHCPPVRQLLLCIHH